MNWLTIEHLPILLIKYKHGGELMGLSPEELAYVQEVIKTEPGKSIFEKAMDPAVIEAERKMYEYAMRPEMKMELFAKLDKRVPGWRQYVKTDFARMVKKHRADQQRPGNLTVDELLGDDRGTIAGPSKDYCKGKLRAKNITISRLYCTARTFLKKIRNFSSLARWFTRIISPR